MSARQTLQPSKKNGSNGIIKYELACRHTALSPCRQFKIGGQCVCIPHISRHIANLLLWLDVPLSEILIGVPTSRNRTAPRCQSQLVHMVSRVGGVSVLRDTEIRVSFHPVLFGPFKLGIQPIVCYNYAGARGISN